MFHRFPHRVFWAMLALTGCAWLCWPLLTGYSLAAPVRWLTALALSLVLIGVPCGMAWRQERRLRSLVAIVQDHGLHQAVAEYSELDRRDPVAHLNRILDQVLNQVDATEHRRRQEYAAMSTGLEEMGHGYIITDTEGRVQFLSPKAQQYWTVPDNWTDSQLRTEVLFRTREAVYDSWHQAVSTGQPVRMVHESTDRRESLLVVHIPLLTAPADPTWLTVQQDTSEVALMRLIRRDFIGNLSHEIRNLLAKLQANTEIATIAKTSAEREKYLQRMLATLAEMSHLQEGLMDLYLIETGLESITATDTCLPAFLAAVHDSLLASTARADIRFHLAAIPDVRLPLDTRKIARVITDLVQNALKFTPTRGQIVLQAHIRSLPLADPAFQAGLPSSLSPAEQRHMRPGPVAVISVRDSGTGIPGPSIPRVFERLHQLDTDKAHQGTGLGLALARHTIRAHGGLIWACNNKTGPGITFSFSLPLAPDQDVRGQNPGDSYPAASGTAESWTRPA